MKNVYLAYAVADEQRAEEVRRILQAQGHRPWSDPQPIAGALWHIAMDAAIQTAAAVVVIVTENSALSATVTYEWAYALGAGVPVFAIIYENAAEHPRLNIVSRYDARAFSDENHFWDHFVEDFNHQLERGAAIVESRGRERDDGEEIDLSVRPTEPGYWLIMRRGPSPNQLFRLERELVNIGRDQANDIVIPDAQISRYHFRLTLQGEAYVLDDLGSTNGTRLNAVQVSGPTQLNDGDFISIGDSIILTYDLMYLD